MKHFLCFWLVFLCSAVGAKNLDLDSARQIEDLEYLFSHLGKHQIQMVTHRYRDGFRLHDYFLGCYVVKGKKQYAGLMTSNWKQCYFLSNEKVLKKTNNFSTLIKDDKDLDEKAKEFIAHSPRSTPQGYWESEHDVYLKGAPCLQYVLKASSKRSGGEFCLHSETTARNDIWYENGGILTGSSLIVAMIVTPILLVLRM